MRKTRGKKQASRKKILRQKPAVKHRGRKPAVALPPPSSIAEQEQRTSPSFLTDLPFSYGETKLVLLVRDPYWAYSYWDFSGSTWNWIQSLLSSDSRLKPAIRVHDLDTKRFFDLLISLEAKNWYLHLGAPDHRYMAELALSDGYSQFYLIVRSNEVRTPRDSPSEVVDPEWNDRDFIEIYRLSGGSNIGLSSPGSSFIHRQP